jgi:hypothetical protein
MDQKLLDELIERHKKRVAPDGEPAPEKRPAPQPKTQEKMPGAKVPPIFEELKKLFPKNMTEIVLHPHLEPGECTPPNLARPRGEQKTSCSI